MPRKFLPAIRFRYNGETAPVNETEAEFTRTTVADGTLRIYCSGISTESWPGGAYLDVYADESLIGSHQLTNDNTMYAFDTAFDGGTDVVFKVKLRENTGGEGLTVLTCKIGVMIWFS